LISSLGIHGKLKILALMTEKEPQLLSQAINLGIGITVYDPELIDMINHLLKDIHKSGKHRPSLHIKIDTGMNRFGLKYSELKELIRTESFRNLVPFIDSVFTHLIEAEDIETTAVQIRNFNTALQLLSEINNLKVVRHVYNSGAILKLGTNSTISSNGEVRKVFPRYELVRFGLLMYGLATQRDMIKARKVLGFKDSLELRVKPISYKMVSSGQNVGYGKDVLIPAGITRIAILPIGYNVLPRNLSGIIKFKCEYNGKEYRLRQLGNICMDCTIIEYPEILPPNLELKLSHDDIEQIAFQVGTVPHELLLRLATNLRGKICMKL